MLSYFLQTTPRQYNLFLTNTFTHFVNLNHLSGQPQGQDGVKLQSSPMTVTVGNVASGSSMSPDQLGSVQSSSDQEGPPSKRLRRVACSCPNCRDGEGRYEHSGNTQLHATFSYDKFVLHMCSYGELIVLSR